MFTIKKKCKCDFIKAIIVEFHFIGKISVISHYIWDPLIAREYLMKWEIVFGYTYNK